MLGARDINRAMPWSLCLGTHSQARLTERELIMKMHIGLKKKNVYNV